MEDEHGAGDGPAEGEVGVVAVSAVGSHAVGAALEPGSDVGSHVGPEETTLDAVESLVTPEVTARGVSMEDRKDVLAQAGRDIDKKDVALEAALVDHTDAVIVEDQAVGSSIFAGLPGECGEEFFVPGLARF